jgi:hemolysin activation/secretion protein
MKTTRLILFILICLTATDVSAVDLQSADPGAIQKHTGDIQDYYQLKKLMKDSSRPAEKPQIEDKTLGTAADKQSGSAKIAIKSIVTDLSEILSDEEIRAITAIPEGKLMTLDDLFVVVDQINALYRSKGFITAKALLPPQKVEAGVVRIRLVEGRVGDIVVEGNEHTKDSFIVRRMSLEKGDLVRLDLLKNDLVHFNAVNDVSIRATIRPGKKPGDTDLVLKAVEPRNYEISVLSDNAGTESVGEERIGVRLVDYSFLGYRDPVTLSGYLSEGTRTLSAGYSFPLNKLGTRLSAGYGLNQVDIKSGPFADLDVGGDSYSYNLNINHPLIFSPAFSMNLFAGYQYNNSTTDFAGVTISRTKIASVPVGFDFRRFDDYGLWYCRNTFTHGSEKGDEGRDFLLYNLDVVRTLIHTDEIFTLIRGNAQLSSKHPLASTEQFQVGGLSSVRGYPEGFLVGDEGYFLSAEIKFPVPYSDREVFGVNLREKLKGAVFVDHGAAFPYRGDGASSLHEDFITGAGIGLSMNFSKRLTGKIDLGFPLARHGEDIDSFRIHFTLQSVVF